MRTDTPIRIALAVVLPVGIAASAYAQEPEPEASDRCDCLIAAPDRGHAFSLALPYFGRDAQLGISLDRDDATDSIGARVGDVLEDGPAAAAGLRAGDVIIAIDGRSIAQREENDARPSQQLVHRLRGIQPGDTVRLDYRRDGQSLAAKVIAAERGSLYRARRLDLPSFDIDVPDVERAAWLDGALRLVRDAGLELADVNDALGDYFGVDDGVLVIDIESNSRLGLEPGDVILRIGDRDVHDARHARSIVASYRDDEPIRIEIMRDGERQTITSQPR